MAQSFLRLRRALSLSSSSLLTRQSLSAPSPLFAAAIIPRRNPNLPTAPSLSRHFRSSSPLSLSSARSNFRNNNNNFDDEIGPDTILFEGCDYNHWLITMEFPKDPVPTPEEMIETYLQTLAQVVGSYEKAKKNMYACSTTTYQGFQCRVSEEESEKFKGLPGVVFVLPDSYIDPVNKEYGGDKYDNGIITHRPPPVQYGRQGGRYGDRNRDFNRNRPNDQGTRGYENQGPRQGGDNNNRNFGQQQNPQFSYQQVNQGPRNFQNQQPNPGYANQGPNFGENRNFGREQDPQVQRNFGPNAGGERNSPFPGNNAQGNYHPNQGNYNAQGEHRDFAGGNRNFGPPQGVTQGQGSGGNFGQMSGVNNYDGQGAGGNFGHGAGGNNSQGFDYQQNNPGPGGEQRNYRQMGQTGTDQVHLLSWDRIGTWLRSVF